ncbi:hypothetical protein CsSME_00019877 [Camellia sinensis var. sinensis]
MANLVLQCMHSTFLVPSGKTTSLISFQTFDVRFLLFFWNGLLSSGTPFSLAFSSSSIKLSTSFASSLTLVHNKKLIYGTSFFFIHNFGSASCSLLIRGFQRKIFAHYIHGPF